MSNKANELNTAKDKLIELINQLQVLDHESEKAIEHFTKYFGNDERIDQFRDERASEAMNSIANVKNQIVSQTKLLEKLVADY